MTQSEEQGRRKVGELESRGESGANTAAETRFSQPTRTHTQGGKKLGFSGLLKDTQTKPGD